MSPSTFREVPVLLAGVPGKGQCPAWPESGKRRGRPQLPPGGPGRARGCWSRAGRRAGCPGLRFRHPEGDRRARPCAAVSCPGAFARPCGETAHGCASCLGAGKEKKGGERGRRRSQAGVQADMGAPSRAREPSLGAAGALSGSPFLPVSPHRWSRAPLRRTGTPTDGRSEPRGRTCRANAGFPFGPRGEGTHPARLQAPSERET